MPKKIKDKIRVNLHSPCQKDRVPQLLKADGANRLIRNVSPKNIKLLSLKRKKDQQVEIFESNMPIKTTPNQGKRGK